MGVSRSVLELPAECTSIPLEPGEQSSKFVKNFPSLLTLFWSQLYVGKHYTQYLLGTLSFISGCFFVLQLLKKTKASIQKSICETKACRERNFNKYIIRIFYPGNTGDGHVLPASQNIANYCLSNEHRIRFCLF